MFLQGADYTSSQRRAQHVECRGAVSPVRDFPAILAAPFKCFGHSLFRM